MRIRKLIPFTAIVSLAASLAGCPLPCDDVVYFLVSDVSETRIESYVLPLTDPDDIAHARALIANPDQAGTPIVVASIARGSRCGRYINRDLLNGGEKWSWHITEFTGFADVTAEIYDGWPGYVEENFDDWMDITGGTIGFWAYTVTRELTPREVLTGNLNP